MLGGGGSTRHIQDASGFRSGALAAPSEAAAAVAYLASDDASLLTGVLLPVDGGYSAV